MFEYMPGSSLLHRLDVRTKTLGFMVLTLLSFIYKSPLVNLCLATLSVALALYSGISMRKVIDKLKPLIAIFVFIILMTGFSYSPEWFETTAAQQVLISISGFMYLTVGGLLFGLSLLLRIIIMVVTSSVLTYSTTLDDFLQLLQKMAMPYQMAFVLTTAIRFVPTMERKTKAIIDAQKARGAHIGEGRFFQRIRTFVPIVIPMIVVALRMSENLAVGMLNRGYGAHTRITPLRELQLRRLDYLLMGLFLGIIIFGITLRWFGFGSL
jgi:energy-coupling factor transport system permease protein